jgi:hypothetical protein
MNTIYYDAVNKKEIVDLSGSKTESEIKKEFGDVNYQTLKTDKPYKIESGVLAEKTPEEIEAEKPKKKDNILSILEKVKTWDEFIEQRDIILTGKIEPVIIGGGL